MARKRLAVLISGRGSNLQSLIDAAQAPDYPAEVVLVVSNRGDAPGLERAAAANIPTVHLQSVGKDPASRQRYDQELSRVLETAAPDLVCLAGFMRLLTRPFVQRWNGRLLNIHPSLLPAFRGLDAQAQAIAAGVKISGCTVHFVVEETDAGPIVGQAAVPVLAGDDAESLAARILIEEHKLYPACARLLCEGKARLGADGVVRIDESLQAGAPLANPA